MHSLRRTAFFLILIFGFVIRAQAADLRFGITYADGTPGFDYLDRARSQAISADGRFMYVLAQFDNAISVFSRNQATGTLSLVEVQLDGIAGASGIYHASRILLSQDGGHLFVTAAPPWNVVGTLSVFSIDATTGALDYVETQTNGVAGVTGLDSPSRMAMSPDGNHIYVSSKDPNSIVVFEFDSSTGALTFVENESDGLGNIINYFQSLGVLISQDGQHAYVTAPNIDAVVVFDRDPATGELAFVESYVDGTPGFEWLDAPYMLTQSPNGNYIYVSGFSDAAISVFSRDPSTGALSFVEAEVDGIAGAENLTLVLALEMSSDGERLYAYSSSGPGAITILAVDPATGALSAIESHQGGATGGSHLESVRDIKLSPDGRFLYAACKGTDAISVFSTRVLEYAQHQVDGVGGSDGLDLPLDVVFSPDGRHAYTASLGDAGIGVFEFDAANADLEFVELAGNGVPGIATPVAQAFDPTGQDLYVATWSSDGLVQFSRDPATGELTWEDSIVDPGPGSALANVDSIVVSPDGGTVYVGSDFGDAVSVWSRNLTTGTLTFEEVWREGVNGVSGLDAVKDLAISPDGLDLYAAAGPAAAPGSGVAHFRISQVDGSLTFGESLVTGAGGLSVIVAPDGADVYVGTSMFIARYERSAIDGSLVFEEGIPSGSLSELTVSPAGKFLIGTDINGDAVRVFARDDASGETVWVQEELDDTGGVPGLEAARTAAISPDGGHTLVVGAADNALVVFVPEPAFGWPFGCLALSRLGKRREHGSASRRSSRAA